jgi:hypothetical protein
MAGKQVEVKETIDDHFRSLKAAVVKEDFKNVVVAANQSKKNAFILLSSLTSDPLLY